MGLLGVAAIAALGAACGPNLAPAPAPAPPPPPAATAVRTCSPTATASAILGLVNQARAAAGAPALAWDGKLGCVATDWSRTMSTSGYRHQDLASVLRRPEMASYRTLGENILHGPGTMNAQAIHDAWMASPPHKANLLSPSYRAVGIGLTYVNGEVFAVEDFGG